MAFVKTAAAKQLKYYCSYNTPPRLFHAKHYEFIAEAFSSNPAHPLLQLIGMFELDNPAFDKAKFLEAINKKK